MEICAVYKITNTITGNFYIGSSNNVKLRWANHKCPSIWKNCPNNPMYQDMQKYGIDKFEFEILAEVETDSLKETEQQFIETLNPTYNNYNAKGWDIERYKEYQKEYLKSHPEQKAKKNKRDKEWRKNHPDYFKNYKKKKQEESEQQ